MTSTLKTELRAFSNLKGLVPTGALKSESVEGSIFKGDICEAYRLT